MAIPMQPLTPEEREHPTPPPPRIGAAVQRTGPGMHAGRAPDDLALAFRRILEETVFFGRELD